jgi:AsmA protein
VRTVLYVVLALVVLIVGAALTVPFVVPQETLRTALSRQLERATGREIGLTGEIGFALVPEPRAEVGGLTVAGAAAVEGPPLLTVDRLGAELALVPLFSGQVQVERFVLSGLEVALIVDERGRANWRTVRAASAEDGAAGSGDTPREPPDAGSARTMPALPAVSLGDVRLVDAALRYTDRAAGVTRAFENVDGTIVMRTWDEPLEVDVTGELDGRSLQLNGRLDALRPLLRGAGTGVEVALAGDEVDVDFAGDVAVGDTLDLAGELTVDVDQASATLGWLAGRDVALPVEELRLAGGLTASPDRVALDVLELGLDDLRGTGDVSVDLAATRPKLSGRLDLGAVDLAAFGLGEANRRTADGGVGAARDGEGDAADGGWSTAPLGYTHPPVDLDLVLTVESLRAPPLNLGAGTLRLDGDAERLVVTLEELDFYDGGASGTITARPAGAGVAIEKNVVLADFRTGPLLADLAGIGFLDGRGRLELALSTRGASQRELVAAADGAGSFELARAVLTGLRGKPELEALRALLALGGEAGGPLRIANAAGTVDLVDGVATNRDLVATTPNMRLTGEGRIDFVERRVPAYTLRAEATGVLARLERLRAVLVPLRVEGPFDGLTVRPDPDAVAPGAVEEVERALEAAGRKAREGDLEGAAETLINEGIGGVLEQFGINR